MTDSPQRDLVHLPIVDLIPYARNPRTHTEAQVAEIAASIREFGWTNPVLVDERRTIIAGHGRVLAARQLAYSEVPAIILEGLTEAQKRALVIADNKLALNAGWDDDLLRLEIEDLRAADYPLDLTGFHTDELADLFPPEPGPEAPPTVSLADRFLIPPMSVLNQREGWWQERKRSWLALGIRSELGRGENALKKSLHIRVADIRGNNSKHYSEVKAWVDERPAKGMTEEAILAEAGAAKTMRNGRRPAAAFGQDLMREGVLMQSLSGRVPDYYRMKVEAEAKLGRALSNEEFEREHLVIPDGPSSIAATGTSIFDPVLCEIAYRWFCPPGGTVIDPFAGGSVRGIVASALGRKYHGCDLRSEQVEENRRQASGIMPPRCDRQPDVVTERPDDLTPVIAYSGVLAKRDDLFTLAGVRGGKVRSCLAIAQAHPGQGLVTAGSISSPQVNIVAHIAAHLGVASRLHIPKANEVSAEVRQAADQPHAELVMHPAGRNTVIVARAREDANRPGWTNIPFGMECPEAVEQTAKQVANLPFGQFSRIVVPVGSGMSLAGILTGLDQTGHPEVPVVGVVVGADPTKRLHRWAPPDWRNRVLLVDAGQGYDEEAPTDWNGITLDTHYEAKCVPMLEPGDLFWIVGCRNTATAATPISTGKGPEPVWIAGDSREIGRSIFSDLSADFLFTCPPYADLEVYSDDPADISNMPYPEFRAAYREIIAAACALLKPDRFACVVVGEVRDDEGNYYDFIGDTVQAFRDAGLAYYNEMILVSPLGSLPVRVARQFSAGRKVGKTHQNVLVFVKGDGKAATAACGTIALGADFGDPEPAEEPPTE